MKREPGFQWLFLDLNSYFASVEQNENPALRGRPVAVVPMDTPHTCAIAASYEAKAYGIKTGTIIRDALKMCPNLTCVLARHDVYVDYHHRILSEIARHIPINKIWSIDELASRLPPSKRTPEAATALARRIRQGLWDNVGPAINCSIGLAPNTLLAKIAGSMKKPNGLTFLTQEDLPGRLLHLSLTDIPGIGANMEKRLNRAGIRTMVDLWKTSPKQARKIWGSVQGERMWYWLHGYDFAHQETSKSMIGHSRVLDPGLRTPEQTRQMARRLLTKAVTRLRSHDLYAGVLSLGIRTRCGVKWRREVQLNPVQDPFTFLLYLDRLWICLMQDLRAAEIEPSFKKVSTLLMKLREKEQITEDLFTARTPDIQKKQEKQEALASAIEKLQKKYHRETVTLGVPPKTLSGYVGTKIAFNRVPDQEEFWS